MTDKSHKFTLLMFLSTISFINITLLYYIENTQYPVVVVEPTLYDEADVQSVRPVDVLHGELVAPHVVWGEAADDQAAGVAVLPPTDAVHLGLELATFNTTVIRALEIDVNKY